MQDEKDLELSLPWVPAWVMGWIMELPAELENTGGRDGLGRGR